MKIEIKYLSVFAFLILFFTGCKDDDHGEIGDPLSKIEGLTASPYEIAEVYLVDEGNPARPERNISQYYMGGDLLAVKFNADFTFEVTPGTGLNFFPESGTWSFDDNYAPSKIILVSSDGVTTEAPLAGPTRLVDSQLKIAFIKRYCEVDGEQKAALGYRLIFNRKS